MQKELLFLWYIQKRSILTNADTAFATHLSPQSKALEAS